MLTPQHYEMLNKWIKEVGSFSELFAKATVYRMSRKSIVSHGFTTSDKDVKKGLEILSGLQEFCHRIQIGVKVFDAVLPKM